MDNASRSERSRNAVIQAAFTIIARDGPGQLTMDAVARESGLSEGGLTHQFPSKVAVLKALLEYQVAHFEAFSSDYKTKAAKRSAQPELAAQIATSHQAIVEPHSVAFALLAALAEDPSLLAAPRAIDARNVEVIKQEAADPDLALLRWSAARGLALTAMFGFCPFSESERERLFSRLLDDAQWTGLEQAAKPAAAAGEPRVRATRRR